MRKRKYSIAILTGALFLSAWGNVIAAGFCSRFSVNRVCNFHQSAARPKPVAHQPSCHEEMKDGRMEASESAGNSGVEVLPMEFSLEESTDKVALDLPIAPCPHCLSHSQPASGVVSSAVAVDPSKRIIETKSPPANFVAAPLSAVRAIVPMEHGPPGNSSARHILINVFRI